MVVLLMEVLLLISFMQMILCWSLPHQILYKKLLVAVNLLLMKTKLLLTQNNQWLCVFYIKRNVICIYHVPTCYFNNFAIELVKQYKYLGVNLSGDMKDDTDVKRQIRGMYTRGNMIIKLFRYCQGPVKILSFVKEQTQHQVLEY